jgi:hypothetical protein
MNTIKTTAIRKSQLQAVRDKTCDKVVFRVTHTVHAAVWENVRHTDNNISSVRLKKQIKGQVIDNL